MVTADSGRLSALAAQTGGSDSDSDSDLARSRTWLRRFDTPSYSARLEPLGRYIRPADISGSRAFGEPATQTATCFNCLGDSRPSYESQSVALAFRVLSFAALTRDPSLNPSSNPSSNSSPSPNSEPENEWLHSDELGLAYFSANASANDDDKAENVAANSKPRRPWLQARSQPARSIMFHIHSCNLCGSGRCNGF